MDSVDESIFFLYNRAGNEGFMQEKEKKLTDLQLTMALMLADKGVDLEETQGKRVSLNEESICVIEEMEENNQRYSNEYSVFVDLEENLISIDVLSDVVEKEKTFDGEQYDLLTKETTSTINEVYQVIDGRMHYVNVSSNSQSAKDNTGLEIWSDSHRTTRTKNYELPMNYQITDGIQAFIKEESSKVSTNYALYLQK